MNMRTFQLGMLTIGLLSVLLVANAAFAIPLTVVNPSFEANVYADAGFSYTDPITGWTRNGTQVTVWNPAAAFYTQTGVIPDGNQVMVIDGAGTYVTQVLSDTLTANTLYTLTVGIGNRIGGTFGGHNIQLRAGGTILNQAINTVSPADNQFLDATVSFFAPIGHAQLGQALEVRLLRAGVTGSSEFDLVRLDAFLVQAPEPSSLLLAAAGLAMLRIRRRKVS
jgi:hypothetical protein